VRVAGSGAAVVVVAVAVADCGWAVVGCGEAAEEGFEREEEEDLEIFG
jgi:hypothetical protein